MDRQQRKRLNIAEALNDLLKQRPIEDISVKDLCEEAGISRSTFYVYFSDIYEVGEWVWENGNREILEKMGQAYGFTEGFTRLFERLRTSSGKVGDVRSLRSEAMGQSYAGRNTEEILARRVRACRGADLTQQERTRLAYASCAHEAMTLKWFDDGMQLEPATMALYLHDVTPRFVLDALGD